MAKIRHIAIFTDDPDEDSERGAILAKLKPRGIEPRKLPADRPYVEDRVRDIHGNPIDVSTTGLRAGTP